MRFARPLALSTLALGASSSVALAQNFDASNFAGLSYAGGLLGFVFGGIFSAISNSPPIWMKVILIVITFCLLNVLLHKIGKGKEGNAPGLFHGHKNAVTILAIAMSIGIIAPLPDSVVSNLFGVSGLFGAILFLVPIIALMYWSHNLAKKGERWEHITVMLLWFVALAYIGGIGKAIQGTTALPSLAMAQGIASLIAIFYIIASIIRAFGAGVAGGSSAMRYANRMVDTGGRTAQEVRDQRTEAEEFKKAMAEGRAGAQPSDSEMGKAKGNVAEAQKKLTELQGAFRLFFDGVNKLGDDVDRLNVKLNQAGAPGLNRVADSEHTAAKLAFVDKLMILGQSIHRFGETINQIRTNKKVLAYLKSKGSTTIRGIPTGKRQGIFNFWQKEYTVPDFDRAYGQIVDDLTWVKGKIDDFKNYKDIADMDELRKKAAIFGMEYKVGGVAEKLLKDLLSDMV